MMAAAAAPGVAATLNSTGSCNAPDFQLLQLQVGEAPQQAPQPVVARHQAQRREGRQLRQRAPQLGRAAASGVDERQAVERVLCWCVLC